ncbi:MAG: GTPase HflX [Candidatus Binatia bacterium]|nr:GTPase HflX [Candidatus Binatia bacterium]
MSRKGPIEVERTTERALLVGLETRASEALHPIDESLAELGRLCETAGAVVVGSTTQRRNMPDVRTFIGSGKVAEIREMVQELCVDLLVFDDPLTPAQQRNLERVVDPRTFGDPTVRIIDRSQIILDIFAQRAQSIEGKLQVELAQLEYLLPRLTRHWTHLSRQQGGGVGTRGPGETQLEVDRRRLRERVAMLRRRLREVARTRDLHRKERAEVPFPTIALVGYTNAGKSTLMNALTGADVLIDDKLFATLDPTVRRLELKRAGTALLSDTVGFIHKLPHQLVEAFKSTLEEVRTADLLLHVVDGSNPEREVHRRVVDEVLEEIDVPDAPTVLVWNKADRLSEADRAGVAHEVERTGGVLASAQTGDGLPDVLAAIDTHLAKRAQQVEFWIPFGRGEILARVHREGRVLERQDEETGTRVTALVTHKLAGQIEKQLGDVVCSTP